MGFVDAVKSFYRRYFDFAGRSSRSEFWWFYLFSFIVGIILIIPVWGQYMAIVESSMTGAEPDMSNFNFVMWLPLILFSLINFIPGIALVVRRFHDRNMSGWFYLLFIIGMLIPLLGLLVTIGFIVLMCLRGTVGPNKYGPDPLGDNTDVFS